MFRQGVLLLLVPLLLLAGCYTTARFDQYAYIQTTSVKVDAMNLLDLATDAYSSHEQEVKQVLTVIDKTYEYERNRPNNEVTIRLWDKLRDTSGHLFGGFVKRWRDLDKLKPAFIQNSRKEIAGAFDQIAQLESKKIKPKQAQ